jgi:hypothetical protein
MAKNEKLNPRKKARQETKKTGTAFLIYGGIALASISNKAGLLKGCENL